MARDSVLGTVTVALVLSVVCALVVSTAKVLLVDEQRANQAIDRQKNILVAAGLVDRDASGEEVAETYNKYVEDELIDLETGLPEQNDQVDVDTFNARDAVDDPDFSQPINIDGPTPGVTRRAKYAHVYKIVKDGKVQQYVLPVYGKGLWSTLYGFLALEADARTIAGISFYEDGETPGLGGEINNPVWTAKWTGKTAYNEEGEVVIEVVKGDAPDDAETLIDGLSGATITTKGVSNLVQYWLGPDAFGPYLARQRQSTSAVAASAMGGE